MIFKYQCLKCGGLLTKKIEKIVCSKCNASWKIDDGVLCFEQANYWGEMNKEELEQLIQEAKKITWLRAVQMRYLEKNYTKYQYIADFNRASWKSILPLGPKCTVLDIGSGLGAITQSLAYNYEKVISVEPISERIRFTNLRVKQENLDNVELVQTNILSLPFFDDSFDLVILNGILEWVGEWDMSVPPREAQLKLLNSLRALLRPGGYLVIGIENRIGFNYFLGSLDHSGFFYTSLLPRKLASLYLRLRTPYFYRSSPNLKKEYRTFTYSQAGYEKLLSEANFKNRNYYYPINGYNQPNVIIPIQNKKELSNYLNLQILNADRRLGISLIRTLKKLAIASRLYYKIVPHFIILAQKLPLPSKGHLKTSQQKVQDIDDPSSIVEKIESIIRNSNPTTFSDQVSCSLFTNTFKNKHVVKTSNTKGEVLAVAKITNTHLKGYEEYQKGFKNLKLIHNIWGHNDFIKNTIPKPLGYFRMGNMDVSIESGISGVPLSSIVWKPRYFTNKEKVKSNLQCITDWLMKFYKISYEKTNAFELLPHYMLQSPLPVKRKLKEDYSTYQQFLQHGDFFVSNIFIETKKNQINVVDWDNLAKGYPPLFDFFCIFNLFFFTTSSKKYLKDRSIELISFNDTFFDNNWFSKIVKEICLMICTKIGLDQRLISKYFLEYMAVKYHMYGTESEQTKKIKLQSLFRDYIKYYYYNIDSFIFRRI
jgi:SAM-dependent methyltransferase